MIPCRIVAARNHCRTHEIAHNAINKFAKTSENPTPFTQALFVSGFPASTNNKQYPICPRKMTPTYAAIIDGLGDIDVGCSLDTPPMDGFTIRAHVATVAMLMRRDNGVSTCSRTNER